MAHLALHLLGTFQALLDGEPVAGFESAKVRALLAYLAVEAHRPHHREHLLGLLWPDYPEQAARRNLSRALSNLRTAIQDRDAGSPFLSITYESIQFNVKSDHTLDVRAFSTAIEADSAANPDPLPLKQALALYQGDFLEGFALKDSPAFEDWALIVRERLQRQASTALQRLEAYYERVGAYDRACEYAWRQVELEHWQEQAHRQLMRLLALTGRRSEALAQYEVCCRLLAEELDVEPAAETRALYERIRDDQLRSAPVPASDTLTLQEPTFFSQQRPAESERIIFVARERELARLAHDLEQALEGRGRVAFITGEAGQGKTSLIHAFARQAQAAYPDLVVAGGNCNAYTGVGDPYLPFREALELLTGDVQARWMARSLTQEHTRRLWYSLPHTAQALVNDGPDLIDILLPGAPLLRRAQIATPAGSWLERLRALVETKAAQADASPPRQEALFEQVTTVLHRVARQAPLLLIIDDMQWADLGSIGLLFHLGRRLSGHRILILGAYRPEEVTSGRRDPDTEKWERHPLEPIVNEFKRDWGNIEVNLAQAGGQHFVQSLLDSEPHCLSHDFSAMLYRQTEGHPLFTVELLRGMQERGDLVQDTEGRWVERQVLDWDTLPARVEAVIAERIGRLPGPLQDILRVASVEGEAFTAEVVAQAMHQQDVIPFLSGELDRRHRLVRAQGIEQTAAGRLSCYRFRHILFQKYLYESLDKVERIHLHKAVGTELEALYWEQTEEVAVQLARHFQTAELTIKAIHYLHQAGKRAARLSAYEEAIVHLNKGLELLRPLPYNPERAQQELDILDTLGSALTAIKGYASPEVQQTYKRAWKLCGQMGETPQIFPVLSGLWVHYLVGGELRTAYTLGEQLLHRAQSVQDLVFIMVAFWSLGGTSFFLGELESSQEQLGQCIALYDPEKHHSMLFISGQDPGLYALSYIANTLWLLGYPKQALRQSQHALTLARKFDHPYSLTFVCSLSAVLHQLRREAPTALELAETTINLSTGHRFAQWVAHGIIMQGWALIQNGQRGEVIIAQMRQAMEAWRATGAEAGRTYYLCLLAETCAIFEQVEEGLDLLDEGLTIAHSGGERWAMAELYRLKGELLLAQGAAEIEVEACFLQALDIARQQSAKSWELRATMNLCRLWQQQGKREQAQQALADIYGWFTEGFDTHDLQEAKALLDRLAAGVE